VSPGGVVFVVDDDVSVRKAVSLLIRSIDLDVEAFSSAREFLAHPLPARPACIVLDLRMPGQSGLDLQENLRRGGCEIPIVFVTGHGEVYSSVRAMKAGAVDFLEKPFSDQVLIDTIQRALDRDRQSRADRAEREQIQRRVDSLTPREREVLTLVVAGRLNKQIGGVLGAAEKTIKGHRGRMMLKMQADSVADLVQMAERVGIRGPAASEPPDPPVRRRGPKGVIEQD
jgi:FixJ family two-component response regulator